MIIDFGRAQAATVTPRARHKQIVPLTADFMTYHRKIGKKNLAKPFLSHKTGEKVTWGKLIIARNH